MPADDILKADPSWTTRRAQHLERYVMIAPVLTEGWPDAHDGVRHEKPPLCDSAKQYR